MTEKELLAFIQSRNNRENETLEYKLKPNFNEIKKNIKEIQDRMHFNILKTIYAFANTEGGDLYIGIREIKRDKLPFEPEGIDECDKKIVDQILEQVDKSIKINKDTIKLTNSRTVVKIKVDRLKLHDKPLFLDGILYVRENDNTKKVNSFVKDFPLYKDKQLYMCFTEGIKSNLRQLKEQTECFELSQFIEGLKIHIKSLIEKRAGYEEKLQKVERLLDQMKQKKDEMASPNLQALPVQSIRISPGFDSLVDKFIDLYKKIISEV